jgi:predicted acylesterase/phospholipase RssA/CRP-like cAMP-binding protein
MDNDPSRDDLWELLEQSPVFQHLAAEARAFVCDALTPLTVPGGATLLREGDTADALYLVAAGRLRVTTVHADGTQEVLNEIGRGEVAGEMALIANSPRSATVHALRDTQLFRLSTDAFTHLVQEHPDALRAISTLIVNKMLRAMRGTARTSPVASVAVVPLGVNAGGFAPTLATAVSRLAGGARNVTATQAAEALGPRPSPDRLAAWCAELQTQNPVVIYEADADATPWTDTCVRQADVVLLVASSGESVELRPVEQAIEQRRAAVHSRTELVVLHPASTQNPRGTRHWLAPRQLDRHHHVRIDRDADVDRVARLLLGRGIGVVFSGGGARGIAEIGVLRALLEAGVPIDAVGGTSIGSILAGAVAKGLTPDELALLLRGVLLDGRSPVDLTLPAISIAAGGRVTNSLQAAAGDLDVEDTWLPAFCISTNLTRGVVEIHHSGPAWLALRASFSIPGVFPPVRTPAGDLLVDGGVLDNMPVAEMRRTHYDIYVIAIDTGSTRDVPAGSLPDTGVVSGWKHMLSKLDPRTPNQETAGMPRILMRLTELGSRPDDDRGDLYIQPPVEGIGLLDFDKFDRLLDIGHREGNHVVHEWLGSATAPAF